MSKIICTLRADIYKILENCYFFPQVRWKALEATQRELSSRLEQNVTIESALKTRAKAQLSKMKRDPNSARATRLMHKDIINRKIIKVKKVMI